MKETLLFVLYLGLSIIGAVIAAFAYAAQGVYPSPMDLVLISLIISIFATLSAAMFAGGINIGFRKFTNHPFKSFFWVTGGMISILLVSMVFNFLIPEQVDPAADTLASLYGSAKNLFLLQVVLIGPICEELMFRGLLFNGLKKYMPPMGALVASSAVFAALHMTLTGFPVLFVSGAIMCFVYHKTKSLTASISIHMINNAIAAGLLCG